MYTISKGPSKIVQKTRRGITQKLETIEVLKDLTMAPPQKSKSGKLTIREEADENKPKIPRSEVPVFHSVNPRKFQSKVANQQKLSPQQMEVVQYLNENWTHVKQELERSQAEGQTKITYYKETRPNPMLQNFEPFDLENWWGKKLYQNLTSGL